jgi:hypothetical protein
MVRYAMRYRDLAVCKFIHSLSSCLLMYSERNEVEYFQASTLSYSVISFIVTSCSLQHISSMAGLRVAFKGISMFSIRILVSRLVAKMER